MSGLIKSSEVRAATGVRPLAFETRIPVPGPSDIRRLELERALQAANARIADLEAETAHLKQIGLAAHEKGHAAGLDEGRRQGGACAAESLALLFKGIDEANARFSAELDALEHLAAAVARETLGRIIGDTAAHTDLLTRTLRQELDRLDAGTVIRIEVSSSDFPDGEALADLSDRLGFANREVSAAEGLPAGGCRIQLVLGQIDLGLDRQWGRLHGTLDALARPEPVQ